MNVHTTDHDYALGPTVTLIRTLADGRVTYERLPALLAVNEAMFGAQNGLTVRSARVRFGEHMDVWGQSQ